MTITKTGLRWRIGLIVTVVLVATAGTVVAIRASGFGLPANAVLGEAVFDTNYFVTASSIANPAQITVDSGGHLYVADLSNNRVLGWHSAAGFANNASADVVIGQVDFIHVYANQSASATLDTLDGPQGVATDTNGNLYVADTLNNRVTEYTSPFASFTGTPLAGESANFAINATNLGLSESQSITEPLAVAVDGNNNLFVADFEKSRVLEFLDPLATGVSCTPNADGSGCAGDTTVDFVLGQSNLTNTGCDDGGFVASASNLCSPYGLAVDPVTNNLYVADMANNRVVVFPAPISTGEGAAQVWGEPDLVSNDGGLGPDLFEFPDGVALDSSHNLYVSDTRNLRVLEYAAGSPYPSTSPSTSWGAGDATDFSDSGQCGGGYSGLTVTPNDFEGIGIALDSSGGLYVADACDSRILVFDNALAPTESGTRVLGQADLGHGLNGNETFNASMLAPNSLVVDSQGRLYVADSDDSRVLGWHNASSFSNGQPADVVIGQPDFISFIANEDSADGNPTAASLNFPMGIAVDFNDNLYVVDQYNSRVLEYDTPFAGFAGTPIAGQSASRLWGQGGDFTGSNCNQGGISATSLCNPAAVAFDAEHDMYVADSGNNRVLEYPFASGFASTTAATVFGVDSSGSN